MAENNKLTDDDIPTRKYPSNKVWKGKRYILFNGEHISFSSDVHYQQYLVGMLLAIALGKEILTDSHDKSAFRRLVMNHINKMVSAPDDKPMKATNADVYVVATSSDIELLYTNNLLTNDMLLRLKSQNSKEMRGAIYEIAVAAAFVRAGFKIQWLKGEGLPEFTALRDEAFDIEAKRRDRTGKTEFSIEQEIRAVRKNLKRALKKKRTHKYIIFIDTDLPPRTSKANKDFYDRCREEFKTKALKNAAIILTNNGYEHDEDQNETGNNSTMIIRDENGPSKEIIEELIRSLHAKLPPPISKEWSVT